MRIFGLVLIAFILGLDLLCLGQKPTLTPDDTPRLVPQTGCYTIVTTVAFSPDGRLISVVCRDQTLILDAATGLELRGIATNGTGNNFATFSPQNKYLVADWAELEIFEVATGKKVRGFDHCVESGSRRGANCIPGPVLQVAFDPTERYIAWIDGRGNVTVTEVAKTLRPRLLRFNAAGAEAIQFQSADKMAVATIAGKILLWDLATNTRVPLGTTVATAATPSDDDDDAARPLTGRFDANADRFIKRLTNESVGVWSIDGSVKLRCTIPTDQPPLSYGPTATPEGIWINTASRLSIYDNACKPRQTLAPPAGSQFVAVSPDGSTAVAETQQSDTDAFEASHLAIVDLATGAVTHRYERTYKPVLDFIVSHDERYVAIFSGDTTGLRNGELAVWDLETGNLLDLALGGSPNQVIKMFFGPDDRVLTAVTRAPQDTLPGQALSDDRFQMITWETTAWTRTSTVTGSEAEIEKLLGGPKIFDESDKKTSVQLPRRGVTVMLPVGRDVGLKLAGGGVTAAFVPLGGDGWVLTGPKGIFDTDLDLSSVPELHWVLADDPLRPLPLEIFMRQFFQPGLLANFLECARTAKCADKFNVPPITDINRTQPTVRKPVRSAPSNSLPQ
jgi:WD40 repeat protein